MGRRPNMTPMAMSPTTAIMQRKVRRIVTSIIRLPEKLLQADSIPLFEAVRSSDQEKYR